jgi:hypothetical protein
MSQRASLPDAVETFCTLELAEVLCRSRGVSPVDPDHLQQVEEEQVGLLHRKGAVEETHELLSLIVHGVAVDVGPGGTRWATHVSSASQAGLLKPRGAAGARADEKEVTAVYCCTFS